MRGKGTHLTLVFLHFQDRVLFFFNHRLKHQEYRGTQEAKTTHTHKHFDAHLSSLTFRRQSLHLASQGFKKKPKQKQTNNKKKKTSEKNISL